MTENENARNNNQALNTRSAAATVEGEWFSVFLQWQMALSLDDGQDFFESSLVPLLEREGWVSPLPLWLTQPLLLFWNSGIYSLRIASLPHLLPRSEEKHS